VYNNSKVSKSILTGVYILTEETILQHCSFIKSKSFNVIDWSCINISYENHENP